MSDASRGRRGSTRPQGRGAVRWVAALAVLAWLAIGGVGGPLVGRLSEVATNDNANFLPPSAESTSVSKLVGAHHRHPDAALPRRRRAPERPDPGRPRRPSRRYVDGIPGLQARRPDADRRRVPAGAPDRRDPQPGQAGRPRARRLPRRQGRGHHRRGHRVVCRRAGPARVRGVDAGRVRPDGARHGCRRLLRRLHHRLQRHRRHPAARRPRRRLPHPAHRLPQPDPALRRAHHRDVRPLARGPRRLPARQERRHQPQRPEPGHPVDPRRRRRHRLRAAPRRALQGGAARRGVDVGGDEDRVAGRARADRGERRDGRPRPAVPAPLGPRQHEGPRPGRRPGHRRRLRRVPDLPARGPAPHRPTHLLAAGAPRRPRPQRGRRRHPRDLGPGRRHGRAPPAAHLGGHPAGARDLRGLPAHAQRSWHRPVGPLPHEGRLGHGPGGAGPPLPRRLRLPGPDRRARGQGRRRRAGARRPRTG